MSEKKITRSLSKGKLKGRVNSIDKRDKELIVSFLEPSNTGATENSFGIAPFPDSDEEGAFSDEEAEAPLSPRTGSFGNDSGGGVSTPRSRGRISVSSYRHTKIMSASTSENNNNNSNNNSDNFGTQNNENSVPSNTNSDFGSDSIGDENNERKQLDSASDNTEEVPKLTRSLSEFKIGGQRLSNSPGVLRRHVPAGLQNSSGPASAPSSPKVQHAPWSPSRSSLPGTPARRDSTDAIVRSNPSSPNLMISSGTLLVDKPDRDKVRRELFETENRLCQDMQTFITVFVRPLYQSLDNRVPIIGNKNDLDTLFNNIEEVSTFSTNLVAAIKDYLDNKPDITFKSVFSGAGANLFEVFSKYTNNFPRANHLLQQLIKKNRNFEVWLDEREKNPELRGRRLQDFLIMPVQRPPRYILLANELLKNTGSTNSEFESLQEAVARLKRVTTKINILQRRADRELNKLLRVTVEFKRATIVKPKKDDPYVKYKIEVLKQGVFYVSVTRTFNHFCELEAKMMKEFEAVSKKNPVLPFERKLVKSVTSEFTKESIVDQALWLRKWLNSILGSPAHSNSIVLAEFLKPAGVPGERIPLDDVLTDTKLYNEFDAHLKKKFCDENLEFYGLCYTFKRFVFEDRSTHNLRAIKDTATLIYSTFVKDGAAKQLAFSPTVNLQDIMDKLSATEPKDITRQFSELYDEAVADVISTLMTHWLEFLRDQK